MFNDLGMQGSDTDGLLEALIRRKLLEQGQAGAQGPASEAPVGQTAQRIQAPQAPQAQQAGMQATRIQPQPERIGATFDAQTVQTTEPRQSPGERIGVTFNPETIETTEPVQRVGPATRIQPQQQAEMPVQQVQPPQRINLPPVVDVGDPYAAENAPMRQAMPNAVETGASGAMRQAQMSAPGPQGPGPQRGPLGQSPIDPQYRDLVNAGHARPERPDVNVRINPQTGQKEAIHRGVLGQIGQHLKSMGQGALAGTAMAGPTGGILGAIVGGVSPQTGSDMMYRQFTVPRWEHDNAMDQGDAAHKLDRIKDVGGMTGIDPLTGQPTYAHEKAALDRELRQMQAENQALRAINQQQNIENQIKNRDAGTADKATRTGIMKSNSEKGTLGVDAQGNQIVTDRKTATARQVTQNGQPVGSMQGTQEAGRERRFSTGEAGKDRRATQAETGRDRRATMRGSAPSKADTNRLYADKQAFEVRKSRLTDARAEVSKAEQFVKAAETGNVNPYLESAMKDMTQEEKDAITKTPQGPVTAARAKLEQARARAAQQEKELRTYMNDRTVYHKGRFKQRWETDKAGNNWPGVDLDESGGEPVAPAAPRRVHGRPNGQGPLHPGTTSGAPRRTPFL